MRLLPLWLWSVAIMVEGFPRPPVPGHVALAASRIAVVGSIVLLWKRWTTIELVLYSLFPFLLLSPFDEISTSYKTPFITLCAFILTAGVIAHNWEGLTRLRRGLILLAVASLAYTMAWHATLNYWEMAREFGYERCFPDAQGCAPLTGEEPPWWELFFRL